MRNEIKTLIFATSSLIGMGGAFGCGDNGGRDDTAEGSNSNSQGSLVTVADTVPTTSVGGESQGASQADNSGGGSMGESGGTNDTNDPSAASVTNDTSSVKTDVGAQPDFGVPTCGG